MDRDLEREILSWRRRRAGRVPTHVVESARPAARRLVLNGREVVVVRRGRPTSPSI
jgi:hypothetical protein